VSVYLDASVLVSLFSNDALTARADGFLRSNPSILIVSDFAAAEFASAIARRVRMRLLTAGDARTAFSIFDEWLPPNAGRAQTTSSDVASAAGFLRRLELTLRAPDAINIAIAQRVGADVMTFDDKMAAGARALGTRVLVG
jgi:uncharacterized protein